MHEAKLWCSRYWALILFCDWCILQQPFKLVECSRETAQNLTKYANQITFFYTCSQLDRTNKSPQLQKLFLTASQHPSEKPLGCQPTSHWVQPYGNLCQCNGQLISWYEKEWKIAYVCKATYFCTYYSAEMGHAKKTIHQTFGRMTFVTYRLKD